MANMISRAFKTTCWGVSVAMAWTWGIGLFFSVQIAIQFGIKGLLLFATINALGLTLFGVINNYIARRYSSPQAFEAAFLQKAKRFKFPFLFYQFLAITLTLFAVLKYLTLPMQILSFLVCVMFVGATIFLGEEFKINRIKYSHLVMFLGVFFSMGILLFHTFGKQFTIDTNALSRELITFANPVLYSAYFIPVLVGFFLGPWLDLQHWQRVIEINKEGLSSAKSYIVGGLVFWSILISHGVLAIAIFDANSTGEPLGLFSHVKDTITKHFYSSPDLLPLLGFYAAFVCLAALATFDSGYLAFKWYLNSLFKDSKSIVFSIIPERLVASPIPWFIASVVAAVSTLHFSVLGKFVSKFDQSLERFFWFELEYYMAFYATFFVMYAVTLIRNVCNQKKDLDFPFLKLLATGLCSLSIFGIGYFGQAPLIMAIGSVIPLIYGIFAIDTGTEAAINPEIIVEATAETNGAHKIAQNPTTYAAAPSSYGLPEGAEPAVVPGCYVKDKWFVHSFTATYQDTNSVGNIYFGMYGMWVGKTRELFFLHTMPDFDLTNTDFFILTRSYEHKFIREAKEFEQVSVHIRIKDYNRKFVTLEHKVTNGDGDVLGKGSQSLMFVNSDDYGLIDIPDKAYKAYLPFIPTEKV